jgi:hypothetical protein
MLQRMDYVTDVLGGVVAHYCFDHREVGGIWMPHFRRVLRRTEEGPLVQRPSAFILDFVDVKFRMEGE